MSVYVSRSQPLDTTLFLRPFTPSSWGLLMLLLGAILGAMAAAANLVRRLGKIFFFWRESGFFQKIYDFFWLRSGVEPGLSGGREGMFSWRILILSGKKNFYLAIYF